jgi:hypothetical protein
VAVAAAAGTVVVVVAAVAAAAGTVAVAAGGIRRLLDPMATCLAGAPRPLSTVGVAPGYDSPTVIDYRTR